MDGRLFPSEIPQRGPWDPKRLTYRDEAEIDKIFNPRTGDRKAETAEALRAVLRESVGRAANMRCWVLEGLEDAAREEWVKNKDR